MTTTSAHLVGLLVGSRYRVLSPIGQGGMQEVFQAHDETLDRIVALKAPKNPSAERRFERSAVLSARVSHPNTAKTLDYFEDGGRPYLIEEFIEGQDLQKVRTRVPAMDPYLVAHLLHHLARGVAASHHVDVVHRDLKPSNIMLSPDLAFDVLKITDFGISKMAEEELKAAVGSGDDPQTFTSSQTAVGALPYMSPEMIRKPGATGKATDIWALGAIAFELLTGTKPFGFGYAAVPRILDGTLPAIPQLFLKKRQFTDLLKELDALLRICMSLDPAARPSADELCRQCGKLCYPDTRRRTGVVESMPFGPTAWGIITSGADEKTFFHSDSVYGTPVTPGDKVCFASYQGVPHQRAHPVVRLTS